jgi:ketosteroid isomerase-like protein
MTERDAVLAANLEFYRAFTARDFKAMEALWARHLPVACSHPGWQPLTERAAVMASWQAILGNPDSPHAACHDEEAFLYGDVAFVICEEELPGSRLTATNVFAKEDGRWRLVHHQSGPVFEARRETRRPPRDRLN